MKSLHRALSVPEAEGGRVLVEIYLNYDCDAEATIKENAWERLVTAISKMMTQHVSADKDRPAIKERGTPAVTTPATSDSIIPELTTANMGVLSKEQVRDLLSSTGDFTELKKRSLELLVRGILQSLIQWAVSRSKAPNSATTIIVENEPVGKSSEMDPDTVDDEIKRGDSSQAPSDDPTAFESIKQKKILTLEGIRKFNLNAKRGMKFLLASKCIPNAPEDIARFLLMTPELKKSMIGEYLGEGQVLESC